MAPGQNADGSCRPQARCVAYWATCKKPDQLELWKERLGYMCGLMVLNVPAKTCKARIRQDEARAAIATELDAVIDRWHADWRWWLTNREANTGIQNPGGTCCGGKAEGKKSQIWAS